MERLEAEGDAFSGRPSVTCESQLSVISLSRLLLRHLRIEKGEKVLLKRLRIDDWLWDLAKLDLVGSIFDDEQRDEAFEEQHEDGVEDGDEQSELGATVNSKGGDLHVLVLDSSLIASM